MKPSDENLRNQGSLRGRPKGAGISAKNWAMKETLRDRYDHAGVSATTVPASLS